MNIFLVIFYTVGALATIFVLYKYFSNQPISKDLINKKAEYANNRCICKTTQSELNKIHRCIKRASNKGEYEYTNFDYKDTNLCRKLLDEVCSVLNTEGFEANHRQFAFTDRILCVKWN